jgi:hypothetical protein
MSNRIKVGIDGASVERFVLRSPAFSEVEIQRHPEYKDGKPDQPTWTVKALGENYANINKSAYGTARAFKSVDEAQTFANDLLLLMDEVRAADHKLHTTIAAVASQFEARERQVRTEAIEKAQGGGW